MQPAKTQPEEKTEKITNPSSVTSSLFYELGLISPATLAKKQELTREKARFANKKHIDYGTFDPYPRKTV